jgi:hypothetical protein
MLMLPNTTILSKCPLWFDFRNLLLADLYFSSLLQWDGGPYTWAMLAVPTLSQGGAVGLMGRSGGAPGMQSLTRSTASATSIEAATVQESMWKAGMLMPARPQQDLHWPLATMVGAQALLPILLLEI